MSVNTIVRACWWSRPLLFWRFIFPRVDSSQYFLLCFSWSNGSQLCLFVFAAQCVQCVLHMFSCSLPHPDSQVLSSVSVCRVWSQLSALRRQPTSRFGPPVTDFSLTTPVRSLASCSWVELWRPNQLLTCKPKGRKFWCALPTLRRSNFKQHNRFVCLFCEQKQTATKTTNLRISTGIRVFQQTKANSTKTWQLQRVPRILNRIQSQLLVRISLQEAKNIQFAHWQLTSHPNIRKWWSKHADRETGSTATALFVSPLSRSYENTELR